MKLKITGFIVGSLVWVFLFWLAGEDFPSERGAKAVFYTLETLMFGALGVALTNIIQLNAKAHNDQK